MAQRSSQRKRGGTRPCNEGLVGPGGFSKSLNPSAWVRAIHQLNSVIVTTQFRSMQIPISVRTSCSMANQKALVDSGATNCFMSPAFIKRMKLGTRPLQKPRKIWNIDNTENKDGLITHYINLNMQTKNNCRDMCFLVTNIGHEDVVLGYPWLSTFGPQFNWTHAIIHKDALPIVIRSVNPRIPRQEPIIATTTTAEYLRTLQKHTIRATMATDLAIKAQQYTVKATIPPEYQKYTKVFSEEESKRFPPKHTWDHAIELKEGSPDAVDCKVYPLNQTEDAAVQEFMKKELEKGYICISKSPYASPFFFIQKKDGTLRPVQDY